jgi:hypothetical protein
LIYKIIVDKQPYTNPSEEKKEYQVDIEELRALGNVYDSLVITKDEDYVMRRLSLSQYGILSVLETPIKETISEINIELFEGDNYVYLMDMTGNRFYAKYIIKNDFTDTYVTINQMNSSITQTAEQIQLTVSQTYETKDNAETNYSQLTQTATEISTEVSKKVGNDEIISKINQSAEAVTINANKISLAGKTIDLTSDTINIASTNFSVSNSGEMNCSKANITGGTIRLSGANASALLKIMTSALDNNYMTYIMPTGIETRWGSSKRVSISSNDPDIWVTDGSTGTDIQPSGITTPTVTQTSKSESKKNFEKLENALSILKEIDIYKYNLKTEEDGTKKRIGFVIGENFRYSKDLTTPNNEGVDAYTVASVCIKAIQEQQDQIEKLKNKIKELEEK